MIDDSDKDVMWSDLTTMQRIMCVVMGCVGVYVLLWILNALSYGGIGFLGGIDQY